ncbi:type II secretory pathway pseudopilin PulG [Bacillus sp. SLBN-46]|uniref:hypothetical protein n=1 Tax=Bacillus sp. SLBN-46 TaxID=3042283 RepID=UPI00285EA799|nr:hypothetical protein [Bacillus sp. SLBN-46]MDR6122185.1 type II secretory pathway pseudopilin PulG [Bacillus sp. SLBN-46]
MFSGQQEQGYALPTVLLIIVIFMVIMLSFMGRAFSSVKQNQVVEKTTQSVALAEMGMTQYQVAVQNIYEIKKQQISDEVKAQIELDRSAKNLQSNDYYVNLGISKMKSAIKSGLQNELSTVTIDGKSNTSYTIIEKNFYETTQEPKVLLKVQGNQNGKTTVLSTVMTFAPTIINLTSGSSASSYTLPNFDSITQPKSTDPNYCKNPAALGTCTNIYVEGPGTFNENNNISGRTIFTTGTLTLGGNANNTTNSFIHTGNSLTVGKNMINTVNVTMETNGFATFGSHLTADSSKLYINGNLTINGKLNVTNKSIVYVNGNTNIGNQLVVSGSPNLSRLCVIGDLTYRQPGSKIGGLLVVKGKINGVKTSVTDQEFQQKCGTPAVPATDVQWGDTVLNDVNYEY